MDKIITGILGIALFVLFVGGLAQSIGQLPFILIVIFICGLACATAFVANNTTAISALVKLMGVMGRVFILRIPCSYFVCSVSAGCCVQRLKIESPRR